MKANSSPRDIDQITKRLKAALSEVHITQLQVGHAGADDDGLWFFKIPEKMERFMDHLRSDANYTNPRELEWIRENLRSSCFAYSAYSAVQFYTLGSVKKNVVPTPSSLWSQTSPPWAWTMCFTIDRPRPVPPVSRERARSTR